MLTAGGSDYAPAPAPAPVSAPVIVPLKKRTLKSKSQTSPQQTQQQPHPIHPARPAPIPTPQAQTNYSSHIAHQATTRHATATATVSVSRQTKRRHWRIAGLLASAWHILREVLHILDRPVIVPISLIVLAGTFFIIWSENQSATIDATPIAESSPSSLIAQPGGQEIQPPAAKQLPLTIPEVRYCLYQEERLHSLREQVNPYSEYEITRYNHEVEDYNSRCLDFRHSPGIVTAVRSEITTWRDTLSQEAAQILESWRQSAPQETESQQ
ncbi:MAG: hypothetical protein OD811_02730 [Alphaproteobacteria bacterium]